MFLWYTGKIVGGYITFAPKLESSIASVKDSSSITYAELIILGSAVIKPSTSVHISNIEAFIAAAIIAAV